MNVITIISDSITPETKAGVMSLATGSTGVATFLDAIPGVIGVIASIVGVIYSTMLILHVRAKRKQDDARERREDEMHELKKQLIEQELKD